MKVEHPCRKGSCRNTSKELYLLPEGRRKYWWWCCDFDFLAKVMYINQIFFSFLNHTPRKCSEGTIIGCPLFCLCYSPLAAKSVCFYVLFNHMWWGHLCINLLWGKTWAVWSACDVPQRAQTKMGQIPPLSQVSCLKCNNNNNNNSSKSLDARLTIFQKLFL